MQRINTIIIGGGQAGLAMSHSLSAWGIDHAVIERGRIAERWRSQRWDSLRLLTPNWMSRLPGWSYRGDDPDGYMNAAEVVEFLSGYASTLGAEIEENTEVLSVAPYRDRYRVVTERGTWLADHVVIATGQCDTPRVPDLAAGMTRSVAQLAPALYRRPAQLPEGGVLIVGASASGLQLAAEIHASGRPVTLAVGRHTRMPRCYRGRDIMWWLEMVGSLGESVAEVRDLERARRQPSLQLVGSPDRDDLDLGVLRRRGVRLVGRVVGASGSRIALGDELPRHTAAADRKLGRILDRIDRFAGEVGIDRVYPAGERPGPISIDAAPRTLDLAREGIGTVIWATGYRRRYPWLEIPLLDAHGELQHDGGITPAPGVYVLGLQFLRRRKSSFIDGVGDDARVLAGDIARRAHNAPTALAA